jgi:electron transfer flavoprotein beta subunit
VVNGVSTLEVVDGMVSAHVDGPDGAETYSVPTPMVATILEGGVEPRYPSLKGRMAAKKVEIEERSPSADPVGSHRVQLTLPPPAPSSVEILGEGPSAAAAVVDLFERLGVR